MTSPKKNPRITITPEAYHALNIQAAIEQTSPGSLASRVILSYSQEAKQALQATGRGAPSVAQKPKEEGSQIPRAEERETGRDPGREAPKEGERPRLFENAQALAKIKELWNSGQRNQAEIARAIGYHRATVNDNIKRMKASGELEG